jgi:hypothetical protein
MARRDYKDGTRILFKTKQNLILAHALFIYLAEV